LIDRTDDRIVREHWRGGGDVVQLINSIVMIAPMMIPRSISRVLIAKVKPTAEGSGLLVNASKFEPLMVEVPERMPSQKPDPGVPSRAARVGWDGKGGRATIPKEKTKSA